MNYVPSGAYWGILRLAVITLIIFVVALVSSWYATAQLVGIRS